MAGLANERNQAVKDWNFAFWVSVGALALSIFLAWNWKAAREELSSRNDNHRQITKVEQVEQPQSDLIARKDAYITQLEAKVQRYKNALTPAQLAALEKQSQAARR